MTYELLVPIIRHGLQALGGFLVAAGYFDESMVDTFIGLGINGGAFLWWAVEKWLKSDDAPDPMDGIQ